MNVVATISLLSYFVLFIVCGRFVTSNETTDGLEATFGETLFLSLFGLDDTPPCKLCGGDESGDNVLIYPGLNGSNIYWWKNGQLWNPFIKGNKLFLVIINGMNAVNIWISSQKYWMVQRLGYRVCCGVCCLVVVMVLSIFIAVVRTRSKVYKDREHINTRPSKRRKTITTCIPTTYHYAQTPYLKKELGNIRKIHKRKLTKAKEHKAIQTMMKLKHSASEEAKYSHQLGLQCLGLKSTDFDRKLFKIRTDCHGPVPTVTEVAKEQNQTTKASIETQKQRSPTSSASFPTAQESDGFGSDLSNGSFDLLTCSELDLSRDIGQPCASSSTIGFGMDDSSLMDTSSSSGYYIQKLIPETVVGWYQRVSWPQWRQYGQFIEMPWIHSFTENSLLDISLHQDSFDLSDVQDTLHMNGLDCTSVYQVAALFAMKTGYDKLKNKLQHQDKSQNCSTTTENFFSSPDDSSEV